MILHLRYGLLLLHPGSRVQGLCFERQCAPAPVHCPKHCHINTIHCPPLLNLEEEEEREREREKVDYVIHFEVCLIVGLFTKFASKPGLGLVGCSGSLESCVLSRGLLRYALRLKVSSIARLNGIMSIVYLLLAGPRGGGPRGFKALLPHTSTNRSHAPLDLTNQRTGLMIWPPGNDQGTLNKQWGD